ncbi:transposase, IS605 OrfB family, central region [Metallosphaera yellowstonensis MK1]|uniref:Transposase, IS605 OrfB family, central region n=1 Tax=Metallosphaera yellowstonensis MK1 TaxID=671065 RepID=H2C5G3_9CREN|nr:IS200/IS605 family element transposase accessory protein TnpB [Metallosphaera yellowstonensis]EHP69040.1 transposase, IS605 OrfB family, central region [Metallosphaera yellowstonensis MK1]
MRERERKTDVLRKTVKRITELARSLSAKVVVGKFSSRSKEKMESNKMISLGIGFTSGVLLNFWRC